MRPTPTFCCPPLSRSRLSWKVGGGGIALVFLGYIPALQVSSPDPALDQPFPWDKTNQRNSSGKEQCPFHQPVLRRSNSWTVSLCTCIYATWKTSPSFRHLCAFLDCNQAPERDPGVCVSPAPFATGSPSWSLGVIRTHCVIPSTRHPVTVAQNCINPLDRCLREVLQGWGTF